VYGGITGSFIGLPLVKCHHDLCGNWSRLIRSEFRQYCPNVSVLMDVNWVMLPNAFDLHAKFEDDILEIMYLETHHHLMVDLRNQALISDDEEIFDKPNDCGNNCALMHMRMYE
jgi:hypothetical protein